MNNKRAFLNLNAETVITLANALDAYLGGAIAATHRQNCYDYNTQPSATVELMIKDEGHQAFLRECKNLENLCKQVKYLKSLLKVK